MTGKELKGMADALDLIEADIDFIHAMSEDSGEAVIAGHFKTAKRGTHVAVVHRDPRGTMTRLIVGGKCRIALVRALSDALEADEGDETP